ncbi:P-loop containing nucleoside triphosphate hydrolase protein [Pseudomassariella vexata]|uniref:p-loop containing nucleoside triphosphate hydrolase protein n=1 Tax=Pseudomassariella vexata TaxID=1141098 RepID=A0A1Y2E892_9PEZI|nr:P-loop containing nucleoside triphosphate hydrolase protein [Pseudomassariella vexata]ORY67075.1 P-loop containing nucleoside triphosphate hydrolase protein [Pseudomassariella vexata]
MPAITSKRSLHAAFEGNDDGMVVGEASSSFREGTRKKARISDFGPNKASSSSRSRQDQSQSSEEENEAMEEPDRPPSPPPATQYEMLRDNGFQHLEDADADDQRATQRLKDRDAQRMGENRVAPNAVIESITCYNFMCHTRLHCELGPLLNFIVGENGSGKSAILTAITLCLGGKASSTNRGASLRSFVKEGQDHARLVVNIKNQGSDAYKPNLYGDTIIVERYFSKSGSSGFKLKSASERLISNKKSDVDDVVEYYCLQVDNPLNVLSQDNARQFLNAASAATKYKYFLQGTQLEQLDHDLLLFNEYLDQNESKLVEYEETVGVLKEKAAKARKLMESAAESQTWRNKSRVYANQLAWAQVYEQEKILQEKENAVAAAEEEIGHLEEAVQQNTENLSRYDNKIQDAREAVEALQQGDSPGDKQMEAEEKYKSAKANLQEMHTQERDLNEKLHQAIKNAREYEKKIEDEERSLEEVNGGALAVKKQELEDAKEAVTSANVKLVEHSATTKRLEEEYKSAEKELQEATGLLEQKRAEVSGAESRLRSLTQNRGDIFAGYERGVPQLLKMIDGDDGFHQKPIGPLGMYIQLTQPKWSAILEATFGGHLNSFIVANRSDYTRLRGYMDRLSIRGCGINIRRSGALLDKLNEPDEAFDTALRVLKFDDVRVRDMMVILTSLEQLILVPKREDGQDIMFNNSRPPQNVAAALTFHDRKRDEGCRITNRQGGEMKKTDPIQPGSRQKARMKSDDEAQINMQKETLAQLQSEFRELEASKRRLQQAAVRCSQAVTRHKRERTTLEKAHREAQATVSGIERELDGFEGADGRLQGLQEALQAVKEKQDHFGQQYGSMAVEKQNQNKLVQTLKADLAQIKEEMADFKSRIAKAENKVQRYQELRRLALVATNEAHEQLDMAKEGKKHAEGSRDRQMQCVQEYIEGASETTPERVYIPEGETYASIERKYTTVQQRIKEFRNKHGMSEAEINSQFTQATEEYKKAKTTHKHLWSLQHGLKKALVQRLDKWRWFQRMISAHARTNFAYLLSERGFRGQLLLDHQKKKLEIQVEPDQTRQNVSGRNTKTLSGGEKSFSSICLLLAIWDAMGSPLRCLDEFDVFMDNVNRAISTNMLIQAARRSVGKQFILITPNAIEGRGKIDKDVKIIRLTDPRQQRLADP